MRFTIKTKMKKNQLFKKEKGREKMKKRILALILSLAMMIALVACGSDQKGTVSNTETPNAEKDVVTEGPKTDLSASANEITSATVETLNVGLMMDVGDFNPWTFTGMGANHAIWGIYQPLMHLVDGEYYPGVLKSYTFSDDGLTLEGEIYDYIEDCDGNHYTADDVEFSMRKAMESNPELAGLIADIKVTGDYTFKFELCHELYVGELNTIMRWNIVSQKAYEDSVDEMHTTPVGSGPYRMTNYTSGYMFTYEKQDNFWQTDLTQISPRDMANVDTVNFYIITESAQRTIALEQGSIDFCSSVNSSDLDKFYDSDEYSVMSYLNNMSMTLFPNCGEYSPCQDLNLRLAICYAINNQAVLDSVYDGKGTLLYCGAPEWDIGVNPDWANADTYYGYDIDLAKDYLENSNYHGETLTIMCSADEASNNTSQLVKAFLEQIGIKTEIQSYESTVFNQYRQEPEMWDILIQTTTANFYYVQAMFSNFAESRWASGGGINFAFDDKLQELLNTCLPETGVSADDIDALEQYIIDNCYMMGMVNPDNFAVVPSNVESLTLSYRNLPIAGATVFSD